MLSAIHAITLQKTRNGTANGEDISKAVDASKALTAHQGKDTKREIKKAAKPAAGMLLKQLAGKPLNPNKTNVNAAKVAHPGQFSRAPVVQPPPMQQGAPQGGQAQGQVAQNPPQPVSPDGAQGSLNNQNLVQQLNQPQTPQQGTQDQQQPPTDQGQPAQQPPNPDEPSPELKSAVDNLKNANEQPQQAPGSQAMYNLAQQHLDLGWKALDERLSKAPPTPREVKAGWGLFLSSLLAAALDPKHQAGGIMYQAGLNRINRDVTAKNDADQSAWNLLQNTIAQKAQMYFSQGESEQKSGVNLQDTWLKIRQEGIKSAQEGVTKAFAAEAKAKDEKSKAQAKENSEWWKRGVSAFSEANRLGASDDDRQKAAQMLTDWAIDGYRNHYAGVPSQVISGKPEDALKNAYAYGYGIANAQQAPKTAEDIRANRQLTMQSKIKDMAMKDAKYGEFIKGSPDRLKILSERAEHLSNELGMDPIKASALALKLAYDKDTFKTRVAKVNADLEHVKAVTAHVGWEENHAVYQDTVKKAEDAFSESAKLHDEYRTRQNDLNKRMDMIMAEGVAAGVKPEEMLGDKRLDDAGKEKFRTEYGAIREELFGRGDGGVAGDLMDSEKALTDAQKTRDKIQMPHGAITNPHDKKKGNVPIIPGVNKGVEPAKK